MRRTLGRFFYANPIEIVAKSSPHFLPPPSTTHASRKDLPARPALLGRLIGTNQVSKISQVARSPPITRRRWFLIGVFPLFPANLGAFILSTYLLSQVHWGGTSGTDSRMALWRIGNLLPIPACNNKSTYRERLLMQGGDSKADIVLMLPPAFTL